MHFCVLTGTPRRAPVQPGGSSLKNEVICESDRSLIRGLRSPREVVGLVKGSRCRGRGWGGARLVLWLLLGVSITLFISWSLLGEGRVFRFLKVDLHTSRGQSLPCQGQANLC